MEVLTKIVKANPTDYSHEIFPKVKHCINDIFQIESVYFPPKTSEVNSLDTKATNYLALLLYYRS